MPAFEVATTPDHGPYRAIIATDGTYDVGRVRIEPPISFHEGFTEMISGDGVAFRPWLQTQEATELEFSVEIPGERTAEENAHSVAVEVNFILEELGRLANKTDYIEYWAEFNSKGN